MRSFKTDDFIKNIISAINVTFKGKDKIKIFVGKIEKETPKYLFIYLTGKVNPNGSVTVGTNSREVIGKHELTLNIIYRNEDGTMEEIYEVNDKLCETLLLIQQDITRRHLNDIFYDVMADTKGVMLNIRANYRFNAGYSKAYDEETIEDIKIKINERKMDG